MAQVQVIQADSLFSIDKRKVVSLIRKCFGINGELDNFSMRTNNFWALEITSPEGDRGYVFFRKNPEFDIIRATDEYSKFYRSVLGKRIKTLRGNDGELLPIFYWETRKVGESIDASEIGEAT